MSPTFLKLPLVSIASENNRYNYINSTISSNEEIRGGGGGRGNALKLVIENGNNLTLFSEGNGDPDKMDETKELPVDGKEKTTPIYKVSYFYTINQENLSNTINEESNCSQSVEVSSEGDNLTTKNVTNLESKSEIVGDLVVIAKNDVVEIGPKRKHGLLDFVPYWGFTSIQGRRSEMEDAVVALPCFLEIPTPMLASNSIAHFYGVYDGHGGSQVYFLRLFLPHQLLLLLLMYMGCSPCFTGLSMSNKNICTPFQKKNDKHLVCNLRKNFEKRNFKSYKI